MRQALAALRTTVGMKIVVAGSGALLWGFVVLHMVGNLKALLGADASGGWAIDAYAAYLRIAGEPLLPAGTLLWSVRSVLGAALVVHVVTAVVLARRSRAARPVGYQRVRYAEASVPARSMLWSGLVLLTFLVLHLLHFTTGTIAPAGFEHGAVYANLSRSFRHAGVAGAYVFAVGILGMHLWHGAWSALQTFGLDEPGRHDALRRAAACATLLIVIGFASVPLAFARGWLPAPSDAAGVRASPGDPP